MNDKIILENIFLKNNIHWKIKDFGEYIDPRCKTSTSIYDKIFRLYSLSNNKEIFTIKDSKIDDLLRMTVIVEYSEVKEIIDKLKSCFSDLSGYLQIEKAGYRGVHLNMRIDGVPCEIQLAPKIVVMAVDYLHTLYEKWRSFDSNYERKKIEDRQRQLLIKNDILNKDTIKQLDQEKQNLINKIEEEEKDFELRKSVYGEVYNIARFECYKEEISSMLEHINSNIGESSILKDDILIGLLNENLIVNGQLNKEKVSMVSNLIYQNIEQIQEKFVFKVKECLDLK